jgi:hypothetical protein
MAGDNDANAKGLVTDSYNHNYVGITEYPDFSGKIHSVKIEIAKDAVTDYEPPENINNRLLAHS